MSNNPIIGVYPGTFDPVTTGHMDIIERALKVVDFLIIAVAADSNKEVYFDADERLELVNEEAQSYKLDLSRLKIVTFKGLLVKFAQDHNAKVIIRGIRAVSDFEYEFKMSCMNSKLDNAIETIFLPASEKNQLISSNLVKEVVKLGGDVGDFISDNVRRKLIAKLRDQNLI